jgi:hypothetical protein
MQKIALSLFLYEFQVSSDVSYQCKRLIKVALLSNTIVYFCLTQMDKSLRSTMVEHFYHCLFSSNTNAYNHQDKNLRSTMVACRLH